MSHAWTAASSHERPAEVWMPGPTPLRVEVHITAEDSDGAFCLVVDHPEPGWGLPPHRHANESESVYLVEGRFEMTVGGTRHEMAPGDSVHVPKGVVHSGAALGDAPCRRVIVFAPGGVEQFFLTAGMATPDHEPDTKRLLELAQRYGWQFEDQPAR